MRVKSRALGLRRFGGFFGSLSLCVDSPLLNARNPIPAMSGGPGSLSLLVPFGPDVGTGQIGNGQNQDQQKSVTGPVQNIHRRSNSMTILSESLIVAFGGMRTHSLCTSLFPSTAVPNLLTSWMKKSPVPSSRRR